MASYKMYIDGKWISTPETFETVNPTTEKVIGKFPKGNEKHVKKAIDAAEDAFKNNASTDKPGY